MVIINRGRVVAVDTPDNLTQQLKGSATLYVQVDAAGADAAAALSAIAGVRQVSEHDRHEQLVGFEVASDTERDIRRDVARMVVDKGWGLLELRPLRLSLEDIFLQLTTDEAIAGSKDPASEDRGNPAPIAGSEDPASAHQETPNA